MKSKAYEFSGKLFRYDFDNCVVEFICKADKEMIEDNKEWQAKHGRDLWEIDGEGYMVLSSVGLRAENWLKKAARDEYLFQWACEIDEESMALLRDFEKYELPRMMKEAV